MSKEEKCALRCVQMASSSVNVYDLHISQEITVRLRNFRPLPLTTRSLPTLN